MPKAQDYYKLAGRCVIWAKEAKHERSREAFKNLALYWEKEARRAEGQGSPVNAEVASAIQTVLGSS